MGAKLSGRAKPSPGPGNYDPDAHAVQRAASNYSLGKDKRKLLKELNANPGPGQHDAKSQLKGPKFGFGSSVRTPLLPDG